MLPRVTASFVAVALCAPPVRAAQPPAPAPTPIEAPVPVAAPTASTDTVTLRDGQILHGTIVELRHGESLTLTTAAGATLTFPWAEIAATSFASATAPAPAPVPAPAPAADAPGPGRPRLHIELTRPAPVRLLEAASHPMRNGTVSPYMRSVCRAPCDQVVDGSHGYPFVFGGDRIPPSRPVYLADLDGDVTARVRPGRYGMLVGGALALPFGAMGTSAGGFLVGLTEGRTERTGAVLLGVGAGLLITSIILLVRGTTRYKLYRR